MHYPIAELTRSLLESYRRHGGINRVDGDNLPSQAAVAEIAVDLLRILFPGFFETRVVHSSELHAETAVRLEAVAGRLEDEIYKSLGCAGRAGPGANCRREAHELTVSFLGTLPRVRESLQTDVEAAFAGDPAARTREEIIVAYPFTEAIAIHRLAHELYVRGVPLVPRIFSEWAHARTGIDIHPGATIGSHFFIDHGTGTVVGETCQLGNHVKMFHGVTLGATSTSGGQDLRGRKRHPTIEDGVTIYSGAVILGGDTIVGARSTVGANVFLIRSVPAESLVVLEEGRTRIFSKRDRAAILDFQI